jgi:hypothetical protein
MNRPPRTFVLESMTRIAFAGVISLSLAIGLYAQSEFVPQTLLKPKFAGLYSVAPNQDALEKRGFLHASMTARLSHSTAKNEAS